MPTRRLSKSIRRFHGDPVWWRASKGSGIHLSQSSFTTNFSSFTSSSLATASAEKHSSGSEGEGRQGEESESNLSCDSSNQRRMIHCSSLNGREWLPPLHFLQRRDTNICQPVVIATPSLGPNPHQSPSKLIGSRMITEVKQRVKVKAHQLGRRRGLKNACSCFVKLNQFRPCKQFDATRLNSNPYRKETKRIWEVRTDKLIIIFTC